MLITYDDFSRVDLRSGIVVKVEPFPRAKKPAYKVWVDFGDDIGIIQWKSFRDVWSWGASIWSRAISLALCRNFFL